MKHWTHPDPYWQLITANYTPTEIDAYTRMADQLEALERQRETHGWNRRVD